MPFGRRSAAAWTDPRLRVPHMLVSALAIGGGLLLALGGAKSHPYGFGHLFTLWYVYVGITAVLAAGIANRGLLLWSRKHPLPPGQVV